MMMEGVRLMVVGMITVFAFLTLLVGMMKTSAAFFEHFAHRFPEDPTPEPGAVRGDPRDEEVALVIAVAEAHRMARAGGRGQKVQL